MKLIKINPRGFCDGVINSWKLILQAKKEYTNSNIYMLGWFVHNKEFVKSLLSHNLFLLDDTNEDRYDLIKNHHFNKNDVIILSAHGTDQKTIDLIKSKELIIIDTTCKYVYKTHDQIKNALKDKENILVFLGKKNHPETNSCVQISNRIILVTNLKELQAIANLYKEKKVHFFNQTTLSIYDLYDFYKYIKNNFTNYYVHNDICNATQIRQEAVMKIDKCVELIIVVGDQKSNNSKSLLKIASQKCDAYLINSKNEIDWNWFTNKKNIGITSGASTPTWITNDIIDEIVKKFNIKEVVNE